MALNLTRLLALFCVFCVLVTTAGTLDIGSVQGWAASLGDKLSAFFTKATQYKKLQEGYRQSSELTLSRKDGNAIANKMKKSLEDVLREKIESIKNLAAKTEELRKNYTLDLSIKNPVYYDTKKLEGLPLEIDPRFSTKVKINKSSSVVHIPTDVYKGGKQIMNTIKWTEGLDKTFKENEEKDPTLLWQYFGSANGVYRVFPGFRWSDPENDIFDSRRRGWYIQGSSSPKDIVLILDLSGSMAGQKLSILKLSALSVLDTLQENDFVNIVAVYDAKPVMVCQLLKDGKTKSRDADCTKDLLQATAKNKKFLQHFIPNNAFAKGIAKASKGFDFAIDVLKESRAKRNFTSSRCTQAVILFTDGIENSQSELSREILEEKNKDKTIRVFTYLVGSDAGATDQSLKKISNDFRGCLFEIQTLSDVREKVLKYVSVLSRPLGFVPGGADISWTPIYLDKLGLGLMITLVAPVFNITENKGELLGVVGTDMPLPQLEGTVPGNEVGVNGYGFAINNNGFVLFHPGLNKEKDPPNIALDEVEYNGSGARELMRNMIDRLTGSFKFTNRLLSEDKRKLSWDSNYHFFYSPVINTSFSAAVAIPEMGLYSLNATGFTYDDKDVKDFLSSSNNEDLIVAPWKICPGTPVAAENTTPVYQPAYANATDIISDGDRKKNCDASKLRNLLFDANITKELAANNWDANENKKNQIHKVFVGTHGGIMRLLNTDDESTSLLKERDYIKEQFYTEAAQYANKGEDIIVFSTPYRSSGYQPTINESAVITASCPIVKVQDKNKVVAAVAGMQFDQEKMNKIFLDVSSKNECNSTDDCFCRLIDDDGFILASNQPDDAEVGKFFGVSEGAVLNDFINQTLFKKLTFNDVQGECKKPEQDSSSARTLLNPLFAVTSYVQFWTQTVFWSLMQFNIYSFFSRGNVALAEEEEEVKIPCSQELQFYKGDWQNRTTKKPKSLECPESACPPWRVFMAAVDNTNLRLVVVKRSCSCIENENTKITTKPQDSIPEIPIPSVIPYRKPPELKSPCDDKNEQGKPPCALASLSSSQCVTVLFLLILAVLMNDHWR